MDKTRKMTIILTLAVAFCFVLVSIAQAGKPVKLVSIPGIPIWQITKDGTAKSVEWVDHTPNPRFAIYDPGTPEDELEDLVLDKETGLVWARDANIANGTETWVYAVTYCRNLNIGTRIGWRLPTVEELASLVDPSQPDLTLPNGHPFQNVQSDRYWSSTTFEMLSTHAYVVNMYYGTVATPGKSSSLYVWPVRGGSGPILVPHTP
jgi:hypothetical protein